MLRSGFGVVTDAEGEVMRRPFGDPALQKCAHVRAEEAARIGVAGGGNRARGRSALGDDELEPALRS